MLSGFGSLLFWTRVLPRSRARTPPAAQATLDRRLLATVRASLAAALLAGLAWLLAEAVSMAGATGPAEAARALPTVLAATTFGHLLSVQGVGIILAALALGRGTTQNRRHLAMVGSAMVLLLQVGHGHAWSMTGGIGLRHVLHLPGLLLPSTALHLLAAATWLGGLLPLLLTVRVVPPRAGATAAHGFSIIGKWCVGAMAATATLQATILVGGLRGLRGTGYGWVACLKLSLFGVLLAFACLNRYRLAPVLLGPAPEAARRRLVLSIAVQTGFGLLVVLAAGTLASLPPGLHDPMP